MGDKLVDGPVIEITIRGLGNDIGKTTIASRLARLLKCEFKAQNVYVDCNKSDIEMVSHDLLTLGPLSMKDTLVFIVDDDEPVRSKTLDELNELITRDDVQEAQ